MEPTTGASWFRRNEGDGSRRLRLIRKAVRPKHSNVELTFRIILTVVFTGVWLIVVRSVWTNQLDPRATIWFSEKTLAPQDWIVTRDPNKLYQDSGRQG